MLLNFLKKENILIINKWNITKLANAAYPRSHLVLSFMVYAFHGSTFLQLGVMKCKYDSRLKKYILKAFLYFIT